MRSNGHCRLQNFPGISHPLEHFPTIGAFPSTVHLEDHLYWSYISYVGDAHEVLEAPYMQMHCIYLSSQLPHELRNCIAFDFPMQIVPDRWTHMGNWYSHEEFPQMNTWGISLRYIEESGSLRRSKAISHAFIGIRWVAELLDLCVIHRNEKVFDE